MSNIKFYKVNEPYGFFSNFSPYPILINGEVWSTVEHYFQAQKFDNEDIRKKIKLLDSPMNAAIEGRNRNNFIRTDWDNIKDDVMKKALTAKFLQHPELKINLLNTKDALIIEDTTNDNYWGNGGDDSGKNKLGKLIMDVREIIINLSPEVSMVLPPWIAFPKVSQYDLFWRMGLGEDYLSKWAKYYLNCEDKEKYRKHFPENIDWEDIYS